MINIAQLSSILEKAKVGQYVSINCQGNGSNFDATVVQLGTDKVQSVKGDEWTEGWPVEPGPTPTTPDPLCFTALEDSTVDMLYIDGTASSVETMLQKPQSHIKLEYKLNDGEWTAFDWTSWALDMAKIGSTGYIHTTTEISIPKDSKLYVRCDAAGNQYISNSIIKFNMFCMTGSLEVGGNINSLLSRDSVDVIPECCFTYLFSVLEQAGLKLNSEVLKSSENLVLPAHTVSDFSYYIMFAECKGMTKTIAQLPATTIAKSSYHAMFSGCTSLTQAPEISATTLAEDCCRIMFSECSSLTQAPTVLPATTLNDNCYKKMFSGCTSLTQAPVLSATTLAKECYFEMFYKCASLTQAPEILATTLADSCFEDMFYKCTQFSEVHMKSSMEGVYNPTVHGDPDYPNKTVIYDL